MVFKLQQLKCLHLESISYFNAEVVIIKLTKKLWSGCWFDFAMNDFRAINSFLVQSGFCNVG